MRLGVPLCRSLGSPLAALACLAPKCLVRGVCGRPCGLGDACFVPSLLNPHTPFCRCGYGSLDMAGSPFVSMCPLPVSVCLHLAGLLKLCDSIKGYLKKSLVDQIMASMQKYKTKR